MNLHEIFDYYYDRIYSFTLVRVGNVHDAEDIASNVFVKVTEKQHTYNPAKAAFSTWIFTIAINEIKMFYRKRRKNECSIESMTELVDQVVLDEDLMRKDERILLFHVINKLDEKQKNAILLKYFGGLSCRQIAEFLGKSESNTGNILQNARTALKKELMQFYKIS